MSKDVIWIIAAPSCVGKSTFIESEKALAMTNLQPHLSIQANHYKRGKRMKGSHYLHFCMKFKSTPVYNELQKISSIKKAVILLVPKLTHIKRIESRAIAHENGKEPAPPRGHLNTIKRLTCSKYLHLYEIVFEQFQKMDIHYTIFRADKLGYPEVSEEELPKILWEGI